MGVISNFIVNKFYFQACDAKSGLGLQDGLDWLCKQLVAAGLQDLG